MRPVPFNKILTQVLQIVASVLSPNFYFTLFIWFPFSSSPGSGTSFNSISWAATTHASGLIGFTSSDISTDHCLLKTKREKRMFLLLAHPGPDITHHIFCDSLYFLHHETSNSVMNLLINLTFMLEKNMPFFNTTVPQSPCKVQVCGRSLINIS